MIRADFEELYTNNTQRFNYRFFGEKPDVSNWKYGDIVSIKVENTENGDIDELEFKISMIEFFGLVGMTQGVGFIQLEDGNRVRIDFRVRNKDSKFEDEIYAYLVTPEFHK